MRAQVYVENAIGIALLAALFVGVFLTGARGQTKDPCETALDNIGAVDLKVSDAIEHFQANKRSQSARRLAVMQAATGKGYLIAMRVLIPLACRGDRLSALDSALEKRVSELDDFMHENW